VDKDLVLFPEVNKVEKSEHTLFPMQISFDILKNNNKLLFPVAIILSILFLGTFIVETQYTDAGQDEDQFNPFDQGKGIPGWQDRQDGDQFSSNIQSQGQGEGEQQLPSQEEFNQGDSISSQSMRLYENPLYYLKVPYPSNWFVDDTESEWVLFAPQQEVRPRIELTILPAPNPDVSKMKEGLKQLMISRGSTIVEEEQSTVNGRNAHYISWTGDTDKVRPYKNAAILTQTNDFLYVFQMLSTAQGFENDLSILNSMFLGAEFSESGRDFSSQTPIEESSFEKENNPFGSSELPTHEQPSQSQKLDITTGQESNNVNDTTRNIDNKNFEEYTNPFGFNISYPSDSEIKEDQNTVIFTIPDKGMSIVSVGAHININTPLDRLLEEQIDNYNRTTQNFELIKSENGGSAEDPSGSIEYELTLDGERIFGKDVIAIVDNTAYSFIFQTEADDIDSAMPIMNNMLDSFRIIQPSVANNQVPSESGFDNSSNNNNGESAGFGQQRNDEGLNPEQTISTLNFLSYRHPTHGFTIEYPNAPGLEIDELNYGVIFKLFKNTYGVLLANIEGSLDKFVSDALEFNERDYIDYKLIDQTDATVNGHDAIQVEYTRTNEKGVPLHTIEYYGLSGKVLYDLVFNTAYPTASTLNDFRAVVQKMIDSFEFPPNGSMSADNNEGGSTHFGGRSFDNGNARDNDGTGIEDDDADRRFGGFGQQGNDDERGFDPFG
jgi:hypothetical protein